MHEWHQVSYESDGGPGAIAAGANASVNGARATAAGSLFSGAMHLDAFTQFENMSPGTSMTVARASVDIWDTVTLFFNGTSVSKIPLHVELDGHADNNGDARFSYHGWGTSYTSGPYDPPQDRYSVVEDLLVTPLTDFLTFKVHAHAFASSASYADDSRDSYADYTHTLKFMGDLPAGVTYTSASGNFNPLPYTAPVPEPSTGAALGLGALAILKRRRR